MEDEFVQEWIKRPYKGGFFIRCVNPQCIRFLLLSPREPIRTNAGGFKSMSASKLGNLAELSHSKSAHLREACGAVGFNYLTALLIKWIYWSALRGDLAVRKGTGGRWCSLRGKNRPSSSY